MAIVLVYILIAFFQISCLRPAQSKFIPYIPPSYYTCTETTPDDLLEAYFHRTRKVVGAELMFNGQVFVFKNIVATDFSIKYATEDYIWVQSTIQCYFLQKGSAKQLKSGQKVDVIGVAGGIGKEYAETLVFTGCIFLDAGSVKLPIEQPAGLALPDFPSY